MLQCGQGNDVLRSEINRWDNNHIDVSMLVTSNSKIRAELEMLRQDLKEFKARCEDMEQDNLRLRTVIAQAEIKEIEQLYGNIASGIETRHVEGNDDDDLHEAINCNLIDSGIAGTEQIIMSEDTLTGKTSLEQSDDVLVNSVKEIIAVTENTDGENKEEVKGLDTPTLITTSDKNDTKVVMQDLTEQDLSFGNLLVRGSEYTTSECFDSGTLMRDASQEETVLVEAVQIRIDQFKGMGEKEMEGKNDEIIKSSIEKKAFNDAREDLCSTIKSSTDDVPHTNPDLSARKSERKLPKTPEQVISPVYKEISSVYFSFERYPPTSYKHKQKQVEQLNMDEDSKYDSKFGTLDTVSTKSFGFSRPSNTFIRKEMEQGMLQYRTYFHQEDDKKCDSFKELRNKNRINVIGSRLKPRQKETERRNMLSRSKSMDMNSIPNNRSDQDKHIHEKASIGRTFSNVDKYQGVIHVKDIYDQQVDWRKNTPFVKERRRGRSENRTRWGIDGTRTLLMGTNHSHMTQAYSNIYIPSHTARESQAQARTTSKRPQSTDRTSSPTPSQASTNTVIRVRQPHCNILDQEAGLY